jgi:hypothetical protein
MQVCYPTEGNEQRTPREMIVNNKSRFAFDQTTTIMTNRMFKEGLYSVLRDGSYSDISFTSGTKDAVNHVRGRHFGLFLKWHGWVGVRLYNRGMKSLTPEARQLWTMALEEGFLI